MSTVGDVHVDDIGTLYRGEIQDAGVAFDPSAATVKKLVWNKPGGIILERDATITTTGTGAGQKWFLEYRLTSALDTAFHDRAGTYKWEGYIQFANGDRYYTNIEEYVVSKHLKRS